LYHWRNSGMTITYSRSSFCNTFYKWESSRGPQEYLSWAVCCAGLIYTDKNTWQSLYFRHQNPYWTSVISCDPLVRKESIPRDFPSNSLTRDEVPSGTYSKLSNHIWLLYGDMLPNFIPYLQPVITKCCPIILWLW